MQLQEPTWTFTALIELSAAFKCECFLNQKMSHSTITVVLTTQKWVHSESVPHSRQDKLPDDHQRTWRSGSAQCRLKSKWGNLRPSPALDHWLLPFSRRMNSRHNRYFRSSMCDREVKPESLSLSLSLLVLHVKRSPPSCRRCDASAPTRVSHALQLRLRP